ncbi:hypothetical protein DNTS_024113 [Danionella cerebrum]|uniref:Uncharacterized protein n=1 Tax=Danionella cerebrum TaxID=2873325 RepID=A0A553QPJ1_9TELE|nr:hypothetical protein DNTS_024113 [Danionella translucida]
MNALGFEGMAVMASGLGQLGTTADKTVAILLFVLAVCLCDGELYNVIKASSGAARSRFHPSTVVELGLN